MPTYEKLIPTYHLIRALEGFVFYAKLSERDGVSAGGSNLTRFPIGGPKPNEIRVVDRNHRRCVRARVRPPSVHVENISFDTDIFHDGYY